MALERDYDWRGLCIEANHGPLRGLAHRACTVVRWRAEPELIDWRSQRGSR